jgi:hypothetical protein
MSFYLLFCKYYLSYVNVYKKFLVYICDNLITFLSYGSS